MKVYDSLIFLASLVAINANDVDLAIQQRIVFGETIKIEDASYQVSIMRIVDGKYGALICGGSIISKGHILSANHCAQLKAEEYVIRSGSSSWVKDGTLHRVVKIISHEKSAKDQAGRFNNDVAIMKVTPQFTLDGKMENVSRLPDKGDKLKVGAAAFVSGWGYAHYGKMTKYNFCAEHPSRKKDICNGDSAVPLIVNSKQAGIVSWSGPGCAIPGRPGVYVDVAKYREWIDEHIKL